MISNFGFTGVNVLCISFLFKANKVKNIDYDAFGTKTGRVHMTRQDYGKLQTRKMKGLKRSQEDTDDTEADSKRKKE